MTNLLRLVVVSFVVTALGCVITDAQSSPTVASNTAPTLKELLGKTDAYLQMFVTRFADVVAKEEYVQEWVGGIRKLKHTLVSDFLLIALPGSRDWIECRDVYEVDGKALVDHQNRLLKLLQENPRSDWSARAAAVARASTRYNLSDDMGTMNRPLIGLALMQPQYRARFTFSLAKPEKGETTEGNAVAFREFGAMPMFRVGFLWGRVWIDPANGAIMKTELLFGNSRTPSQVATTFRLDPELKIAVPIGMAERYVMGGVGGEIRGNATYGQFRRFGVTSAESFAE